MPSHSTQVPASSQIVYNPSLSQNLPFEEVHYSYYKTWHRLLLLSHWATGVAGLRSSPLMCHSRRRKKQSSLPVLATGLSLHLEPQNQHGSRASPCRPIPRNHNVGSIVTMSTLPSQPQEDPSYPVNLSLPQDSTPDFCTRHPTATTHGRPTHATTTLD